MQASTSAAPPALCKGVRASPSRGPSRAPMRRVAVRATRDDQELFSPSKINVFLRVMRRREDGYHDLASLFHVIDLGDTITYEPLPSSATEDVLTCTNPGVPTDNTNLVIRALDLYRAKTGTKQHFKVHIVKRVPFGGGMGGGSANGSTTLWAANQIAPNPVSEEDLLTWSAEIGSDCPVFFSLGAAYVTGRGEFVEDVEPPLPLDTPLFLIKPEVGLSTPLIFKALDLSRRSTEDPRELLDRLRAEGAQQRNVVNDLEQPAFDTLPELAELKRRLMAEGDFTSVFMTGSGSTMVGLGGSGAAPAFCQEEAYAGMMQAQARFITRKRGEWFAPSRVAAASR